MWLVMQNNQTPVTCLGRRFKRTASKQQQHKSQFDWEAKVQTLISKPASIYVPIKYNHTSLFSFNFDLFLPIKKELDPFIFVYWHFKTKIAWLTSVQVIFFSLPQRYCCNKLCLFFFFLLSGRFSLAVLEHVSFCSFIHCWISCTSICHRVRCLQRRLHALFLKHYYVSVTWH